MGGQGGTHGGRLSGETLMVISLKRRWEEKGEQERRRVIRGTLGNAS